ncbi:MAG: nucleotidyltransferase domain-containing protein [Deltaproteobacteria bacterium]|nr:nucleotidyltransferase domain-containing protein [Deltaproteobacteria bacterium]
MAEIPDKIINNVKKYIDVLNRNGFGIKQAVLFGSYANGNYNKWSDIDIALVSDKFEGIRFNDRKKIRQYKFEINEDIEPLPYTPDDFATNDPFIKKILQTGIRIV